MEHTEDKDMDMRRELLCDSYSMVKIYAISCGVPEAYLEDVVQDVFVSAYAHLDQLRDVDKMQPWLYRITRNKAARFFLQKSERKTREEAVRAWFAEQLKIMETQTTIGEPPEIEILRELVFRLKPPAPKILQLHYGMGFSLKEVAKLLQMNYNTVKTTERRAREKLRAMLEEEKKKITP